MNGPLINPSITTTCACPVELEARLQQFINRALIRSRHHSTETALKMLERAAQAHKLLWQLQLNHLRDKTSEDE